MRGFPGADGSNLVHLHNVSGGILTDDDLALSIAAGAGSSAQVTTAGATRIYRRRPTAGVARCSTSVEVGTGATLEYLPDPLIPYAGSAYHQDTTISLRQGATLYWWEVIAPGREACGERFAYHSLRIDSSILSDSGPIAVERILIDPHGTNASSPLRLGSFSHWATFYVCRPGESRQRWLDIERDLREFSLTFHRADEVRWGVACLHRDGIIVRGMARSCRHLSIGLAAFWSRAKLLLSGQAAVPPRKLY